MKPRPAWIVDREAQVITFRAGEGHGRTGSVKRLMDDVDVLSACVSNTSGNLGQFNIHIYIVWV